MSIGAGMINDRGIVRWAKFAVNFLHQIAIQRMSRNVRPSGRRRTRSLFLYAPSGFVLNIVVVVFRIMVVVENDDACCCLCVSLS